MQYLLERSRQPLGFGKIPSLSSVEEIKVRGIMDPQGAWNACIRNLDRFQGGLPVQASALLSVIDGCLTHSPPLCIAPRLDANGKHVILDESGDVVTDYVRWSLRGANVSIPECSPEVKPEKNDLNIPMILENLRLVRPLVEERLSFSLDEEPAMDLLNFLDTKNASQIEASIHEFLELSLALQHEPLGGRPVEFVLDPQAPLPNYVVAHAAVAALNPFSKTAKDTVVLLNPGDTIHDTVKRFVKFATNRLGFAWSLQPAESDDYLRVVGPTTGIEGVSSVDGDPFRLGAQHLIHVGVIGQFRKREYDVINCKRPQDNSLV